MHQRHLRADAPVVCNCNTTNSYTAPAGRGEAGMDAHGVVGDRADGSGAAELGTGRAAAGGQPAGVCMGHVHGRWGRRGRRPVRQPGPASARWYRSTVCV